MTLIIVEGQTNSGKTTLIRALAERLSAANASALIVDEIVDEFDAMRALARVTNPAAHLHEIDAKTEFLLYAARLATKARIIRELTQERPESVLLCDRGPLSLKALAIGARKLSDDQLGPVLAFAWCDIQPDLTIVLDVETTTVLSRSAESPLSRKDIGIDAFGDRTRQLYLEAANADPATILVESGLPPAKVCDVAWTAVQQCIRAAPSSDAAATR